MESTQLMSPFAASTWHQTLSQTDGRDKLFRLIQYACKLLRGLDNGHTHPPSEKPSARLFDLERSLGTSRQIWRLFKWASIYVKARSRTITITPRSRLPDASSVLTDAGLFGYYIFDNITFLAKLGVLKLDVAASSRRAAKFWLVAVLSGLIGSLYRAIELHRRYETARKEAARKELEDGERTRLVALLRMRRAAFAVCVKYAGDTFVAWSLSKREPLHPALVGACGTASSFVGLWQQWPKYMPTG